MKGIATIVLSIVSSAALMVVSLMLALQSADMRDGGAAMSSAASQLTLFEAASKIGLLCAVAFDVAGASIVTVRLAAGYSRKIRVLALVAATGCLLVASSAVAVILAASSHLWPISTIVRVLGRVIQSAAGILVG